MLALLSLVVAVALPVQAGKPVVLDPERVAAIESALPVSPGIPVPTAEDRAFWGVDGLEPLATGAIGAANDFLREPIPDAPDELYLEYYTNGNRSRYQAVLDRRIKRVPAFALAGARTGDEKYIDALEEALVALCKQKSWVLPAHDANHATLDGKEMHVDLVSSDLGAQMAYAVALHESRLDPSVVALVRAEVQRRVVDPFLKAVDGERPRFWWMDTTNNWNAVCLGGVSAAALAAEPSRNKRARVVAAAEALASNFLKGFTPDGYCSEGVSYWNYGFGRFVLMAEVLNQSTGGKVDLLAMPGVEAAGRYGSRITTNWGWVPAFSDCGLREAPSGLVLTRLARRWDWAAHRSGQLGHSHLVEFITYGPDFDQPRAVAPSHSRPPLREWFHVAGVYLGRNTPGGDEMEVAFKGGHNDEHHNHNDVGSYVVWVAGTPALLDPGRENYTARTFSSRRYESKLLSSYGHPVPVIDGQLQRTGRDARAVVLAEDFGDEVDSVTIYYASCYAVDGLGSLTRQFVFDRAGRFQVIDEMTSDRELSFETALITLGEWERYSDNEIRIEFQDVPILVAIDTGGAEFQVTATEIVEDAPVKPTRIAITLKQPTRNVRVALSVRYAPVSLVDSLPAFSKSRISSSSRTSAGGAGGAAGASSAFRRS